MAIRSMESLVSSRCKDWDFLSGVLDGCLPSDIEGYLEKNGRVLILESKLWVPEKGFFEPYGGGQLISFERFARSPNISVIALWSTGEDPHSVGRVGRMEIFSKGIIRTYDFPEGEGRKFFEDKVKLWFTAAKRAGFPKDYLKELKRKKGKV